MLELELFGWGLSSPYGGVGSACSPFFQWLTAIGTRPCLHLNGDLELGN
jgi:hypothetical protein